MQHDSDEAHRLRMPSLGELISQRRSALGYTYERLAEESDGALSKQRWQQLGTDTRVNEFPEPRTLQLIADVIDVGVDRVILATAVTLGVNVPNDRSTFATMLPPDADRLTDRQRDAVYAVIRAMADPQIEAHDSGAAGVVQLRPAEPDAPVDETLADAARSTPANYRKGGGPADTEWGEGQA